jgi:hydrogenase nickel incorporation protein HypA/HybF
MHELPLVRSVIEKASANAAERGSKKVSSILLVVGDGSGYVPESIQMYFDIASAGSPCEGAQLSIRRVKPLMKCNLCGKLFERRPFTFDCPGCGGEGSPTETGQELYIEEIEIEVSSDKGETRNEGNNTGARDGGHTHGKRQTGTRDARGI